MGNVTMTTDDYRRLRNRVNTAIQQMEAIAMPELSREMQVAFEDLSHADRPLPEDMLRDVAAAAKRLEEAATAMKGNLLKLRPMAGNVGNTANRLLRTRLVR